MSVFMNVNDAVKLRIIELCDQNKISLNKMCTKCGITQSTINNIMHRNHSTKISTIQKICEGMDISLVEFFSSEIFSDIEKED